MAKGKGIPRGLGGLPQGGGMMNQIKRLQEQMEALQAQLAEETVTVSVGGGAIKVTMTGAQVCRGIEIDPDLLKDGDLEMIQDMLVSGVNLALEQSRKLAEERMGPLTAALGNFGF